MPYGTGDNYGRPRGDYYQGDYYQGDLFGFLKKAVGTVAHLIPGVSSVVSAAEAVGGAVRGLVSSGAHPNLPAPRLMLTAGPGPQRGIVNVSTGVDGGDQTGLMNIALGGGLPAGRVLKGYHLNKVTYETRGGGTSRWPRELELHPKGSVLVRNRRMNVGNTHALKRSLRRVGGFARLARRVMSFTHPRAGRGHFKFKKRARR
jgi:hypothetical protein